MTPVFTGKVTDEGKILFDRPRDFREYMDTLRRNNVQVVVRRYRSKRSNEANRYYWGCVVALMAEEFGYTKDELHEVLAMKFLRIEDCPITGVPRRKRTPNCDTKEFSEYVDACIRLAAEHGIHVPAPDEVEA